MIVLDTNVLSELMKRKGSKVVRNWATQQPVMSLFTTTITQATIATRNVSDFGSPVSMVISKSYDTDLVGVWYCQTPTIM